MRIAILSRNPKLYATRRLVEAGTGFAHHPGKIDDLIKMLAVAPVVIKLLEGTQDIGVVLAHTQRRLCQHC